MVMQPRRATLEYHRAGDRTRRTAEAFGAFVSFFAGVLPGILLCGMWLYINIKYGTKFSGEGVRALHIPGYETREFLLLASCANVIIVPMLVSIVRIVRTQGLEMPEMLFRILGLLVLNYLSAAGGAIISLLIFVIDPHGISRQTVG